MKNKSFWIIFIVILIIAFFGVYKLTDGFSLSPPSNEIIQKGIQLTNIESGWIITERSMNKIKIVPFVKFRVKNMLKEKISKGTLNFVVSFKIIGDKITYDSGWGVFPNKPIKIGETSPFLKIQTLHGYIGSSPQAFEANKKNWKILRANIFVKYKGSKFVKLTNIKIRQKII
jgi:hypothetical protein